MLEKKLLEVALKEWKTMPHIGTTFSPQLDKDVSVCVCVCVCVCECVCVCVCVCMCVCVEREGRV